VVDGGRDRPKDTHGGPDQQERAGDADANIRFLQRPKLQLHEVELRRKVPEHEIQHFRTFGVRHRDAAENRERQQQKREQGQEGVIGDRRREREAVAAVEIDAAFDDREAAQTNFAPDAAHPAPKEGHSQG
jgi:hypothetical protein